MDATDTTVTAYRAHTPYTAAGVGDGPGESALAADTAAPDRSPEDRASRGLWIEEPVGRVRLPDPVRTSAVRAGLIVSVTLIEAVISVLGAMAGTWIAAPALLGTVVSTVVATWAVLDIWVTRQTWQQRFGVVSKPSSAARALRRERRKARRAARSAARATRRSRPRQARRHRPESLSRA